MITDCPTNTQQKDEAYWTERHKIGDDHIEAINALYELRNWIRNGIGVPRADHTMLFSGYDIMGQYQDASTIGERNINSVLAGGVPVCI